MNTATTTLKATEGQCQQTVTQYSRTIMGKGTESRINTGLAFCKRGAVSGGIFCKQHQAQADHRAKVLAARKAK